MVSKRRKAEVKTITFKPGRIGITLKWATGEVQSIADGSQAQQLGAKVGTYVWEVDDQKFAATLLDKHIAGKADYKVSFGRCERNPAALEARNVPKRLEICKCAKRQERPEFPLSVLSLAEENDGLQKLEKMMDSKSLSVSTSALYNEALQAGIIGKRSSTGDAQEDEPPEARALKKSFQKGIVKGSEFVQQDDCTLQFESEGKSCTFIVYRPCAFLDFREKVGLVENAFVGSLTIESLTGGTTMNSGKSGALFWFSADRRYILKTMERFEVDALCGMMKEYTSFLEAHPNSLLARYFAAYSLTRGGQELIVVVMNNVFRAPYRPDFIYDLKGTTEDRFAEEKPGAVLKDLNFAARRIKFDIPSDGDDLLHFVKEDSEFLRDRDLMDYSIILGVYYVDGDAKEFDESRLPEDQPKYARGVLGSEMHLSRERPCVLFVGLIDLLQPYNLKKKAAHLIKAWTLKWKYEIDTEPPRPYADRLNGFLSNILHGLCESSGCGRAAAPGFRTCCVSCRGAKTVTHERHCNELHSGAIQASRSRSGTSAGSSLMQGLGYQSF